MKHLARKLFFMSIAALASYTHPFHITVLKTNQAEEQTWQQLRSLFIDTFCTAYEHLSVNDINSNFATTAQFLENLFDTDRTQIDGLDFDFILAMHEHEILGYILSCYCEKEKTAYIHHLVVDGSKQSKGVGKNLIKACEDMYSQAQFVALSTRTFNHKALGFYKHVGFYDTNVAPEIAYTIRPHARNNPKIVNLEKAIVRG